MKFILFLLCALVLVGFLGFVALGFAPVEVEQAPVVKVIPPQTG